MNSKEKGWLLQTYRQVLGSCILIGGAIISDQWFQIQACGHPFPLMPKGEKWRQRERCRQKGSMLIGGAWVVVINDKGGDCWWNCHWCQHGQGPCTHKTGSWCHDLAEDAEDPANDDVSLGDDAKALVDDGKALHRLKKTMKPLYWWKSSWSPLLAWRYGHWWLNEVMKPLWRPLNPHLVKTVWLMCMNPWYIDKRIPKDMQALVDTPMIRSDCLTLV